jgi:hypothetical protein
MMLIGKIALGLAGTVFLAGAVVSSEGFIHVRVHETAANGTHLSLIVPAMLLPLGAKFIPQERLRAAAVNEQVWMPIVDTATSALQDSPDMTLVEVTDPQTHVNVAKADGSIVVDVQDPDETVHVAVPLRALRGAMHEIAAKAVGQRGQM